MVKRIACSFCTGFFIWMLYAPSALSETLSSTEPAVVFDGIIEPYKVVEVGTEVPGVIESLKVERGDMVKSGQVMAILRSGVEKVNFELSKARSEMNSNIKAKQASLEFAIRSRDRFKDLYDVQALPLQKWDEVETQRVVAENELAEAIEQKQIYELEYRQAAEVLKRKTIQSPIDGVVMERYHYKGEYVEDKPILKVAQIDPLNVEVLMTVLEIGSVKVGMKAMVKPEAPVNGEYEATVTIVDKVVDAATGTFGVRMEIPNPNNLILPGLKCKVVFQNP